MWLALPASSLLNSEPEGSNYRTHHGQIKTWMMDHVFCALAFKTYKSTGSHPAPEQPSPPYLRQVRKRAEPPAVQRSVAACTAQERTMFCFGFFTLTVNSHSLPHSYIVLYFYPTSRTNRRCIQIKWKEEELRHWQSAQQILFMTLSFI